MMRSMDNAHAGPVFFAAEMLLTPGLRPAELLSVGLIALALD